VHRRHPIGPYGPEFMVSQKVGMNSERRTNCRLAITNCGRTVKRSDAGETEGDSSLQEAMVGIPARCHNVAAKTPQSRAAR
jgi:hypothetical protein